MMMWDKLYFFFFAVAKFVIPISLLVDINKDGLADEIKSDTASLSHFVHHHTSVPAPLHRLMESRVSSTAAKRNQEADDGDMTTPLCDAYPQLKTSTGGIKKRADAKNNTDPLDEIGKLLKNIVVKINPGQPGMDTRISQLLTTNLDMLGEFFKFLHYQQKPPAEADK